MSLLFFFFFFFNDTATTEIYTLSLHDALPILDTDRGADRAVGRAQRCDNRQGRGSPDRKSTRLNSSHLVISYAVFCLKKKKQKTSRRSFHLHQRRSKHTYETHSQTHCITSTTC